LIRALIHIIGWMRPLTLVKWAGYLIIPAMLWVIVHFPTLQTYFREQDRLSDDRAVVKQLQLTQAQLQREKEDLKPGGFQEEKVIREKFRMTKPDERIIFIEPATSTNASTESLSVRPSRSNR